MFAKTCSGMSTKDAIKAAVAQRKQISGGGFVPPSSTSRCRGSIPRQRHIKDSSCVHNARTENEPAATSRNACGPP
jgi:hypothetical protein